MIHILLSVLFTIGLFIGMIALLELGRRIGKRRSVQEEEGARAGLGAVEGAVFALFGLLIAFTFSGAASRFDTRRDLIVQEANAIGTAWLRLDLLPEVSQPELRELFRTYVETRLAVYQSLPDLEAARRELDKTAALQSEIWSKSVAAAKSSPSPLTASVIPALNEMIDITTTRTMATRMHPPVIIILMMGILALASSLLAGYAMAGGRKRSWIHVVVFSLITAMTVYVILDLEFPRLGIIRVDSFDQVLVELRHSMK